MCDPNDVNLSEEQANELTRNFRELHDYYDLIDWLDYEETHGPFDNFPPDGLSEQEKDDLYHEHHVG